MRLSLPLVIALAARAFAAEIPIKEPAIVPADSFFIRGGATVSAGDAGFLVSWYETAGGPWPGPVMTRAYDRDGNPYQPVAVRATAEFGRTPKAVWTGSDYLLVYARALSRWGSPQPVPSLFALRITGDGKVIERSLVELAKSRTTGFVHEVVWTGTEVVALATLDDVMHFVFLETDGRVKNVAPAVTPVSDIASTRRGGFFTLFPRDGDAVAVNEEKVAAVENTSVGVIVSFFSPFRTLLGGFLLAPEGSSAQSIAWDGSAWVTAYVEKSAICRARFTSEADVVRSCQAETFPSPPVIDAYNGRTLMTWSRDGRQVFTDRGIASTQIAVQQRPDATIDPTGLLVAWSEDDRIHVGGFTHDGAARPVHGIETEERAFTPRVANAGAQSLLVWQELHGAIRATRLDATGAPVPPVVELGQGRAPDVTSNGTHWLVAWRSGEESVSTLVSPNLDSNGLQHYGAPATAQYDPAVAATSNGFLVVWNEVESVSGGDTYDRIVAEPLDAGGLRISGGIRLVDRGGGTRTHAFAIGCRGGRCVVAWDETAPGRSDLASIVIGADGKPLTEVRVLRSVPRSERKAILPFEHGFRLFSGDMLFVLADDGTTFSTQRWTDLGVQLGAAVEFRGRNTLVYSRDARVFVRDLVPRARAVRH